MNDFIPGVVMPVGPGRVDFATRALSSIVHGSTKPEFIIVILDGFESPLPIVDEKYSDLIHYYTIEKHEPGREQPRNIGVRLIREAASDCTHVWFVDSDVLMDKDALRAYAEAYEVFADANPVMMGPYDWMPPGKREPMPELRNDPRWAFFEASRNDFYKLRGGLNAGLACFSGNLVWPIDDFILLGGFWNEIHHGRCEDGEFGIRAYRENMDFLPVSEARGWHMDHPRDLRRILDMNARDVPLLNERHPWVQDYGVFVAERDGKRLEQRCGICNEIINTIDWWKHQDQHTHE